jgi:hypothetical protein
MTTRHADARAGGERVRSGHLTTRRAFARLLPRHARTFARVACRRGTRARLHGSADDAARARVRTGQLTTRHARACAQVT